MLNYSWSINDKRLSNKKVPIKQFDQIAKIMSRKFKIKNDLFFDLSFVDKNQIKHINKKYRKVNKQTDVISFAFYDSKNTIKSPLLGEIFICFEIAEKQAKENNWSLIEELCFLFIHGILHLLQHDHQTKKEYVKMMKIQTNILKEVIIK